MTSVLLGILLSIFLASTFAETNVNELQKDYAIPSDKAQPYSSSLSVSDISLTTPPDIPLTGEYDLPSRDYVPFAREYESAARECGPSAREYMTPAREYGPPAREYGTPAREYGTPARQYGSPAREYGPPAREYGPPARGYGTPAREYGVPEYGPPARELGPYPPSPFRSNLPSSSYSTSPVEFGPSPPTAFGAPPPFPPSGPDVGPLDPHEAYKNRLYVLFEPVAVLIVGVSIFVLLRHYAIPYLIYFARSLEEDEEEERSLKRHGIDAATVRILRAVTRGVCLEKVSCQWGVKAKNYALKNAVISAIDEYDGTLPRLAIIFREASSGRVESCEPYICQKPSTTTTDDMETTRYNWRRKEITNNKVRRRK